MTCVTYCAPPLPQLLFTAGMTLIDSLDSILMLYSYAGFPEHSWAIFEHAGLVEGEVDDDDISVDPLEAEESISSPRAPYLSPGGKASLSIQEISRADGARMGSPERQLPDNDPLDVECGPKLKSDSKTRVARDLQVKRNMMSGLSIILTLMSIVVAFSVSLITIMGLIGNNCRPCREAASAQGGHGGGLAGRWWRVWAKVCCFRHTKCAAWSLNLD